MSVLTGLVSAGDLRAELAADEPPVVIDVRFQSERLDHAERYAAGHIPGAIFADTVSDLADPPGPGRGLRPLPSVEAWQNTLRRWGLKLTSRVVVYDDHLGLSAGRAWWLLRWAGISDVRLLDRGCRGWGEQGFPTSSQRPDTHASNIAIAPGHLPAVEIADIADAVRRGSLIDVRSEAEYSGRKALPGIPARGHIPSAINVPMADGFTAQGSHHPIEKQRERYARAGVDGAKPVVVYCGAGGGAAHEVFVLSALGIQASLFMGSWSAWSVSGLAEDV